MTYLFYTQNCQQKSPNVSPNSRTNVIDDANDGLEDDVNALLGSMISNGEIGYFNADIFFIEFNLFPTPLL